MAGPTFRTGPVRVRVPASSANLGPGFDALGLALSRYDDVEVGTGPAGLRVDVTGEGAADVPWTEAHLLVRALRTGFAALGGQPAGIEVSCVNRIPHGRGLGSSAAAIVAGLVAARALVVDGSTLLDDDGLLRVAAAIEGHPDNVAACLHGGLTVAWTDAGIARAVRLPPDAGLHPVLYVPASTASTAEVRALLPATVPHTDATVNAGRAALLVHALRSAPGLLMAATEDRLHQAYRAPAMPRSAALVTALRAAGVPAVVSGAGPSVLAFAPDAGTSAGLGVDLGEVAAGFHVLPVSVDLGGAVVASD